MWNTFNIPKCSFITWLVVKNRLLTRDRMNLFGMTMDQSCVLCRNGVESINHLLTSCLYFNLMRSVIPFQVNADWARWQQGDFFLSPLTAKFKAIAGLHLTTCVYSIWKERNFRIHNPGPGHPTVVLSLNVKSTMREKLFSCSTFRKWVQKDPSLVLILF